MVHVIGFEQLYSDKGVAYDVVIYAPEDNVQGCQTRRRINEIIPRESKRDREGISQIHQNAIWSKVGPKYEAWKSGNEIPEVGTALAAWAGINERQALTFKAAGIRTVEGVAEMTDIHMQKVSLPGLSMLKRQAIAFLDGRQDADIARQLAESERTSAAMAEQMKEMAAQIAALTPKQEKPPKAKAEANG